MENMLNESMLAKDRYLRALVEADGTLLLFLSSSSIPGFSLFIMF